MSTLPRALTEATVRRWLVTNWTAPCCGSQRESLPSASCGGGYNWQLQKRLRRIALRPVYPGGSSELSGTASESLVPPGRARRRHVSGIFIVSVAINDGVCRRKVDGSLQLLLRQMWIQPLHQAVTPPVGWHPQRETAFPRRRE